jgi:hemoglobin
LGVPAARCTSARSLGLALACAALWGCAGAAGDRLYHDLGGQPGLEALVDRLLERIADDPRIVKRFADTDIPHFRRELIDQLCQISGGPCTYSGDTMEQAHAGMNLTHGDFNALVEDLIGAMEGQRLSLPTQNRLLSRLAPMYPEVVHR